MKYRLVHYDTQEDDKHAADDVHEYWCTEESDAWHLWWTLVRVAGQRHVEVYNMLGQRQNPEKGVHALRSHSV